MNGGTCRAAIAWMFLLGASSIAHAQAAWDVTGVVGVFAGHQGADENETSYDDWFHTGQGGIMIGRHVTRHLKVEFDASATGTGTRFIQRYVTVPGSANRALIGAEAELAIRSLAAAATWQFFDNEWVHPFVTAGFSADFDRRRVHVWQQPYYTGDARVSGNQTLVVPESRDGPDTTTRLRGLVGAGVKFYFTERGFVRTDGRITLGPNQQNVAFRIGIGLDF